VGPLKRKKLTIAIDGPSGSGKSTVARALAERLGYLYIDTGAMYRAVALKIKEKALVAGDASELARLVSSIDITLTATGKETSVFCDGKDVTQAIRSPEISRLASDFSRKKVVRGALVKKQREMGRGGGVVLEGRDIGTVVFPDAEIKFYLDADLEERGRRRFKELVEKGMEVDLNDTIAEVKERDHHDMHRTISPLRRAEDAFYIDSTGRSVEEIVEEMFQRVMASQRKDETLHR
jgi:CMP/dCMP kinase